MLRITATDRQPNNVGHEIPFLWNSVDEEVRHAFRPTLRDRIAGRLAHHRDEWSFGRGAAVRREGPSGGPRIGAGRALASSLYTHEAPLIGMPLPTPARFKSTPPPRD